MLERLFLLQKFLILLLLLPFLATLVPANDRVEAEKLTNVEVSEPVSQTENLTVKTPVQPGITALKIDKQSFYMLDFYLVEPKSVSEAIAEKKSLQNDLRAEILKSYLEKRNSPMTAHAEDFIAAADANGVDWKLVPAISGVESSFGKHIPGGHHPETTSYNGWGWGVYGNNVLKFKSWNDAIYTLNKGLKEKYIDQGLTTPLAMNRKYAASTTWGVRVEFFMNDIDKYAKNYEAEVKAKQPKIAKPQTTSTEAGISAVLGPETHLITFNPQ